MAAGEEGLGEAAAHGDGAVVLLGEPGAVVVEGQRAVAEEAELADLDVGLCNIEGGVAVDGDEDDGAGLGLGDPEIVEATDPSTVTLTMRIAGGRRQSGSDPSSVLDAIKKNGDATVAELAAMTGLSTSTVTRRIRELRDSGAIVREGSKAKGRWVVVGSERSQP